MPISDSAQPDPQTLDELIREARDTAREQLNAASQLQIDRLHDQLAVAFQGDLQRIFDDRLGEAVTRLEEWRRADAERARVAGRREGSERLSQIVRRLRQFESETQWSQSLLDGTQGYCERAALFVVRGSSLEFRGARGLEGSLDAIPLASAPAFAGAAETKDTVVALRTAGELSEAIAEILGASGAGAPESRAYVFPVITGDRAAALLYADAPAETSAIELLCSVAGAVLDAHATRPQTAGEFIKIELARANTWMGLNREEQAQHLRAQRFARVQVAEMRLYQAQGVRNGRAERNIYGHLKAEIDAGRDAFRNEFLAGSHSMLDYFHVELVRTLANDDADLLGPDYPGPMI